LIDKLPALNAVLNSLAALLLCSGYLAIRRKRWRLHAGLMLTALAVSLLFLVSYVTYHSFHGTTRYPYADWRSWVYYPILFSHTVLAAVNVPLVVMTVARALRGRFGAHKRIARWTLPIWLYVSVTGVVVYLMLYRY
jgi:putative membrane protein